MELSLTQSHICITSFGTFSDCIAQLGAGLEGSASIGKGHEQTP